MQHYGTVITTMGTVTTTMGTVTLIQKRKYPCEYLLIINKWFRIRAVQGLFEKMQHQHY